jgi:putative membrane protein
MISKRMSNLATACCSITILAAGTGAFAQADGSASPADKHFVKEALMGGMAEVQLGQLASQKGASDDVKKFGQQMVEDHTKLGDQMKGVASQVGVTPPASVSPADKALMARLQGLSGDQFDKAYIRAMVKDHEKDLKDFQTEASTGTAQPVKDAASQGSSVISQHLAMIKQIAQAHNVMVTAAANGQ